MYSKFSHLELKPHHHVKLDKEFKEDCQVWSSFLLSMDRGLNRPFVDISDRVTAETLNFFTDAAKGESLGIGGIFGHRWYFAQWEPGFITDCNPSIEYLELLGVCLAVHIWNRYLINRRIVLFCDNQSVVTMINNMTAKCKNCMILIQKLVLLQLHNNTRVFCRWIRGKFNVESDMLSRQKISQFKECMKEQGRTIDAEPTPLQPELWPVSKIWVK